MAMEQAAQPRLPAEERDFLTSAPQQVGSRTDSPGTPPGMRRWRAAAAAASGPTAPPSCLPLPTLLQLTELATNHTAKFVSGGVQKQEESVLFTEAGLHPGSPRYVRSAPWSDEQQHQQQQLQGQRGGGGGEGSLEAAAQVQAVRPKEQEDGGQYQYVYRQVSRVGWGWRTAEDGRRTAACLPCPTGAELL